MSTLSTMAMAGLPGLAVLAVAANQLGKQAGLGFAGRLALGGAFGFGVFAFLIKIALVFQVGLPNPLSVTTARAAGPRVAQVRTIRAADAEAQPRARPWRALPAAMPEPVGNRSSPQKIALGRKLFFDTRLSADGSVSCASCHDLARGGDDGARVSTGIGGLMGNRNAPSVLNAAFLTRLFWDGRAASLEEQAKGPLTNPVEMAMPSHRAVEAVVNDAPDYRRLFAAAFDTCAITIDTIVAAIAAYERSLVSAETPYDRFARGDDDALTVQQQRGMALFDANGCRNCHVDPTFSSAGAFNASGVYRTFPVFPDNAYVANYGLLVDGKPRVWRVPSLRNVAVTAPYFHNGAVNDLEEAIRVMAVSQLNKVLSDKGGDDLLVTVGGTRGGRTLIATPNRALSRSEISDIAAFLESLTSPPL